MGTIRNLQILIVEPSKTQNFISAKLNGFTVVALTLRTLRITLIMNVFYPRLRHNDSRFPLRYQCQLH